MNKNNRKNPQNKEWTLYTLIREISEIITPDSDEFFNYVINTSDDNGGFLRTSYCWKNTPLKDRSLGRRVYKSLMVTMKQPFKEEELYHKPDTLVQLQLDYVNTEASFEDAEWDIQSGYIYVYIFNLEQKSFVVYEVSGNEQ